MKCLANGSKYGSISSFKKITAVPSCKRCKIELPITKEKKTCKQNIQLMKEILVSSVEEIKFLLLPCCTQFKA